MESTKPGSIPDMDGVKGADSAAGVDGDVAAGFSADAELSAFYYLIVTSSKATSVHDEQGALVLFNPSCTSLLGYERGELSSMEAPNIVDPADAPALHAATAALTPGQDRATARVRLVRKDGDSVAVDLDISMARVAGRLFTVVVSTPIDDARGADRAVTWAHAFN
ncbi:PAS domain-containing protein [Actinomycetes bacterium M1A6_2h]